ncbi:DUF397 domain-containing protein [Streptomyces sp. P9(2023)]|uniref:DUF397 domain-containing protein n=1 Tax=Streptomyces sp. P9(2023) TaxID=3064394 RepID=UPI0028F42AFC|nr:DUF397 domain-containing protein [Streptomyces sp. P9(2023)]
MAWRKSSHSGANSNCVETGRFRGATVVRDSKNPTGPALHFAVGAWGSFMKAFRSASMT